MVDSSFRRDILASEAEIIFESIEYRIVYVIFQSSAVLRI
jgi:hypothetical protein